MTDEVHLQVPAYETRFFQNIKRVTMFDVARNNAFRESHNIESPLLQIKKFGKADGFAMRAEHLKNDFPKCKKKLYM